MLEKVIGFALTLGLIAWNVFDIVSGRGTILTWVALGVTTSIGIGETAMFVHDHQMKTSANFR